MLPYIICHRFFFKLWWFFYIYLIIYIFYFLFFIFLFVDIVLVQFCIILVRNGMFYEDHKSSFLVTIFYYIIDTVYIYSWKKIDKTSSHFGDALCKKFFLSHMVFNLTIEWTPRDHIETAITLLIMWFVMMVIDVQK